MTPPREYVVLILVKLKRLSLKVVMKLRSANGAVQRATARSSSAEVGELSLLLKRAAHIWLLLQGGRHDRSPDISPRN